MFMGIMFIMQYGQKHDLKAVMRNFLHPKIGPMTNILALSHCLWGRGRAFVLVGPRGERLHVKEQ